MIRIRRIQIRNTDENNINITEEYMMFIGALCQLQKAKIQGPAARESSGTVQQQQGQLPGSASQSSESGSSQYSTAAVRSASRMF